MIELLNIDCMEYMKTCTDNQFDLAIVDPPYGIDIETSGTYFKQFETRGWDNAIPTEAYFTELKRVSKNQIIWGGNYFLHYLGSTKCFLIWDKMIGEGMSFADAELAWTSFNKPTRIKKLLSRNEFGKIHPTQKPKKLYQWILAKYAEKGMKILDTHLGSGSIAIACHYQEFDLVGCEIDTKLYDAMMKRFKDETAQTSLFLNEKI